MSGVSQQYPVAATDRGTAIGLDRPTDQLWFLIWLKVNLEAFIRKMAYLSLYRHLTCGIQYVCVPKSLILSS